MSNLIKQLRTDVLPKRKSEEKTVKPKDTKTGMRGMVLSIMLMFVLATVCFLLAKGIINKGSAAIVDSYQDAFIEERESTRNYFYQRAFDKAHEKYYTSSSAIISVENIEKTEKLHVLKVYHIAYITEDDTENAESVTSWVEAEGEGTFKVDLAAAEFIVDHENRHVLVRIPKPTLDDICVNSVNSKLYRDDDWKNGAYSMGVDRAAKQWIQAQAEIENALRANQEFFESACNIAKSVITNLVKSLNPDVYGLIVEVEFVD